MQKERKSGSRKGVWYSVGAASLFGAIWLFSGLFGRTPTSEVVLRIFKGFGFRHTPQKAWIGVQAPDGLAHSQAIGHAALRQYADYHLDHLGPYFPAVSGNPAIIPRTSSFKAFVSDLKTILDKQSLPERAFDWIFSSHQILNKPHPNCGGSRIQQVL